MKVHGLLHVEFEDLGAIHTILREKEITYSQTNLYNGEVLPNMDTFDCLIVMGGPMGIYDDERYPWLEEERAFIQKAIDLKKRILGICLGSQLIAHALGAKVYKGPFKEIGWHTVNFSSPFRQFMEANKKMIVFHWHGDTFSLPEGCVPVGRSEGGILQGFIYDNHVLALQFHLEMTEEGIEKILVNGGGEIDEVALDHIYIQSKQEIQARKRHFEENEKLLTNVIEWMLKEPDFFSRQVQDKML